jgi:outer membrane protein TolC
MNANVVVLIVTLLMAGGGCRGRTPCAFNPQGSEYLHHATAIAYPDASMERAPTEVMESLPPVTLSSAVTPEYWDLSLEECVQLALRSSEALRNLGGAILSTPGTTASIHTPAIQETDPRFGVEGVLSAFDAAWTTRVFYANNDRALNNFLLGGGTRMLQQDLINYSSEITKLTATGTRFGVRGNIAYDYNNAPGNASPNLPWSTNVEAEARHPFLRGGGLNFNRIAGPNNPVGVYNGVLIARINTDVSLADFEIAVRDMINDVENAYWELHFAYRSLDASITARQRALAAWRRIEALKETGRRGGSAEAEARAREQYFRAESEVQNTLAGRLQDRSRSVALRGAGGVHANERRLRLLLGVPIADGRLIRPVTEPSTAEVAYLWEDIVAESLSRRVELRRQHWLIRRRELELVAAKNHLLPQLDLFTRYRWRGLGHDLLGDLSGPPFDNAAQDLLDGNFQEAEAGVEFALPIGLRQGHAAIRNAHLRLCHEQAVLRQQEREVVLEISDAVAEKERAHALTRTSLNRFHAAREELAATEAVYEGATENDRTRLLDLLLDAQRRLTDAELQYHRTILEYMLALKQIHYAKGTLLDFNHVHLAEGGWSSKAHCDASTRYRTPCLSP